MPPLLFTPRMWLLATPTSADSTGTLAMLSASSSARRIELTAASRLTIRPLRKPLDSAAPNETNLTVSSSSSPIRAQVLVLPMSRATRYRSFFPNPPLLAVLPRFSTRPLNLGPQGRLASWCHGLARFASGFRTPGHPRCCGLGFWLHHHLPREPQVH